MQFAAERTFFRLTLPHFSNGRSGKIPQAEQCMLMRLYFVQREWFKEGRAAEEARPRIP